MAQNKLALSAAARTASTADDLKALTDQRVLLAKAIATETERLKNATTQKQAQKYADTLTTLEGQDATAFAAIQSIESQAASKAKTAADKIAAEAKKKADAAKKAADAVARAEAKAVAAEESRLNRFAALNTQGRQAAIDRAVASYKAGVIKAAELKKKLADAAIAGKEGALGLARQAADLAITRAGDNKALLDKATALAVKADNRLIAHYAGRAKALRKTGAIIAAQQAESQKIATQIDKANLKKSTAGASNGGFTLGQLFQEAGSEFAMYGSNIGAAGAPLSPQAARGALGGIIKTHQTQITQVFIGEPRPNQAMNDARASSRNLK